MTQAEAGVEKWRAFGDVGINLGTWRWDLETGLVVAERRLAEVFGIDPSSAENGVPLALFADAIDPRDRKEFDRSIRQATETHNDLHVAYRIPRPDGSALWVLGSGSSVDEARAFMGAVMLLWHKDVTPMEVATQYVIAATRIAQALGQSDLVYFLHMALHEMATIGAGGGHSQ